MFKIVPIKKKEKKREKNLCVCPRSFRRSCPMSNVFLFQGQTFQKDLLCTACLRYHHLSHPLLTSPPSGFSLCQFT